MAKRKNEEDETINDDPEFEDEEVEEEEEPENTPESNEDDEPSTKINDNTSPAVKGGNNSWMLLFGALAVIVVAFFFIPIGSAIGLAVLVILVFLSVKIVRPTERGVVERLGKYNRYAEPGLNFVVPVFENIILVNITERMVDAQSQEVITKDNLNAVADAQVYFRVEPTERGVTNALYNVNDFRIQIVSLVRTTLRNIVGTMDFKEVNSNRMKINSDLADALTKETKNWGIQVVRAELKEIAPPNDVQETMNRVLKAANEKQAAIDFATAAETKADGERRAKVKEAEGQKQSTILVAEGQAQSIKLVNEAATKYFTGQAVELKKIEAVQNSLKDNTKFVVSSDTPLMEVFTKMALLGEGSKKK